MSGGQRSARARQQSDEQNDSETTDELPDDTSGQTSPTRGATETSAEQERTQQEVETDAQVSDDTSGQTSPTRGATETSAEQERTQQEVETDAQVPDDTSGQTSPTRGATEAMAETDVQEPPRTASQTSPTRGHVDPSMGQVEGVSGSRVADIQRSVASQTPGVYAPDVTVEREELSESERQDLREQVAERENVDPSQVQFQETPYRLQATVSEGAQERAAETQVAAQYENVDPIEIQVERGESGDVETEAITDDAQLNIAAQESEYSTEQLEVRDGSVYITDEAGSQSEAPRREQPSIDQPNQQTQNFDKLVTDTPQSSVGPTQSTVRNFRPSDAEQPSFQQAVVGGTTSFFRDPYGATIEHGVGDLETELSREVGFDVGAVSTQTGETVIERPGASVVAGSRTIYEGAGASADDVLTDGPAVAGAVATPGATAPRLATGISAVGASAALPLGAAVFGARGVQEGEVSVPTEQRPNEVGVPEQGSGQFTQSELETDQSIDPSQTQSEVDVQVQDGIIGGTGTFQQEIPADSEPNTAVDEVGVPGTGESGDVRSDAITDQPQGGFDDLPRDDELGEETTETDDPPDRIIEESEESEPLDQARQRDNRPLYEREYLQEEVPQDTARRVTREEQVTRNTETEWLFEELRSFRESPRERELQESDYAYRSVTAGRATATTEPTIGVGTNVGTGTGTGTERAIDTPTDTAVDTVNNVGLSEQTGMQTQMQMETIDDVANPEESAYEYEYGYETQSRRGRGRRWGIPELPDFESDDMMTGSMNFDFGTDTETGAYVDPFSGVFDQ